MDNINSQYKGEIISEHHASGIASITKPDIQSKSNINVISDADADVEREAFLTTAKHNAAIMFAKYL